MEYQEDDRIARAVRVALDGRRTLLAVSGGIDSMVLLDVAARVAPEAIVAVATFDHGTGDAARDAAAHVLREARSRGLRAMAGRARDGLWGEAEWRDARWRFLRETAANVGATAIATAHTRDDQVETVAMRILRDASARGLAGLRAPSDEIVRPLLAVSRAAIERYAAAHHVAWCEDPTNRDPRFLRNRVRHELLPTLRAVRPTIDDELLAVGESAAEWRRDVDAFVARELVTRGNLDTGFHVATGKLGRYDAEAMAVLWPAIAALAGVRLDRRGTARLVAFTIQLAAEATVGAEMQLSGAVDVVAGRGEIVLRSRRQRARVVAGLQHPGEVPLDGPVSVNGWRLAPQSERGAASPWNAWLPADRPLTVRAWRAGDRMRVTEGRAARRVKRFLADARVPGRDRDGWPVVLAGGEIVWIPGVRRSDAATDRPGQPGVHYLCERIDG